jgi:hypothetical protein
VAFEPEARAFEVLVELPELRRQGSARDWHRRRVQEERLDLGADDWRAERR